MPDYTLTENEETITEPTDQDVHVTNCASFQNLTNNGLRWSTIPFSATNNGAYVKELHERIYSAPIDVYFKRSHYRDTLKIHVRSVLL